MLVLLVGWAGFAFLSLAGRVPDPNELDLVLAMSVLILPVAALAALVFGRWGFYELRRRPIELQVTDDGLVFKDASGAQTTVPYDSPAMDTLPWFIAPGVTAKSWQRAPGAGGTIWIPPDAMRSIRQRMSELGLASNPEPGGHLPESP